MQKQGILIAGVGLPAAGKSTILKALAEKKGWHLKREVGYSGDIRRISCREAVEGVH